MDNGTQISLKGRLDEYSIMKTDVAVAVERKEVATKSFIIGKKRKNYYAKFLEMLVRKTDSERRAELFGKDPFK